MAAPRDPRTPRTSRPSGHPSPPRPPAPPGPPGPAGPSGSTGLLASPLLLSHRLPWAQACNALAAEVAARRARGEEIIDLTESNPTRVGIAYPEAELAELLRQSAISRYEPHPLGMPEAREALAAVLSRPGDNVAPEDLVLTASTSEAYSYLFKLFGDPGDEVLAAAPAYPLLDDLALLDGLTLRHFQLEPGRRFALDAGEIERALGPRSRLLVLVHPANPTGSLLSPAEQDAVVDLCAAHGLPWISDEVFADYVLEEDGEARAATERSTGAPEAPRAGKAAGRSGPTEPAAIGGQRARAAEAAAAYPGPVPARHAGPAAARKESLVFSLGGLSKSAGLPGWKLGWIRIGGPAAERRRIAAALELVADTYLSAATSVQRALGGVLALAPRIQAAIRDRLRRNLAALEAAAAVLPEVDLFKPQAGWSAVLRVPHLLGDEELALGVLRQAGVLVHPGYFFDFATDGFLVISLLPESAELDDGVRRLAAYLGELIAAGR
jgi:alanine-synthesizing transaminase